MQIMILKKKKKKKKNKLMINAAFGKIMKNMRNLDISNL